MTDLAAVLAPKSDQINAQDLIGGDMVITIVSVAISPGAEQPVSIRFEGSEKVWRPCKTTGRVLMAAWGPDTSVYKGRSVQLYLDPKVKWAGMEVGGIRIRAVSHIERDMNLMLSESKQNRKPHKVAVLRPQTKAEQPQTKTQPEPQGPTPVEAIAMAKAVANNGTAHFREWFNSDAGKACRATGALTPEQMNGLKTMCERADATAADPFNLPPIEGAKEAADLETEMKRQAEAFAAEQEALRQTEGAAE